MKLYLAAITALFIATIVPGASPAQSAMSAAEFDQYTRGKTFYYDSNGTAYGAEEYLEDRQVRWSFLDGQCQKGHWYPEGENICFLYENRTDPQCWRFTRSGAGVIAQFEGEGSSTELYEVEQSNQPLHCLGPDVGV